MDFAHNESTDSIGNYQTYKGFLNNLEESISLTEKTGKKLLPIFQELQKRAVQFRTNRADDGCSDYERIDLDDDDLKVESAKGGMKQSKSNGKLVGVHKFLDMRHILGFLNQSEWVNSLNIGNIMQITPIQRDDLTMHRRNE